MQPVAARRQRACGELAAVDGDALSHSDEAVTATLTITPSKQLNRAYVQSKVIEANLDHLRVVLLDASADLRDGLKPLARGFEQYVQALNEACIVADADAAAPQGEERGAVPAD